MATEVTCPSCQSRFRVAEQHLGKQGKCPRCQQRFVISEATTPPPAMPPTPKPRAEPAPTVPTQLPPQVPVQVAPASQPRQAKNAFGLQTSHLIIIGICIPFVSIALCCGVGTLLISSFQGDPPTPEMQAKAKVERAAAAKEDAARSKKVQAWVRAENYVKKALKSPSTADFGGLFNQYQDPDVQVVDMGGGKYRVGGWVDSQNSFGATLRANFAILLLDDGSENWKVLEGPEIAQPR